MNRNGFVAPLVIFGILALAVIGAIAYVHYIYLPRIAAENSATSANATSSAVASSTASLEVASPVASSTDEIQPSTSVNGVDFQINGSHGPLTIEAGSKMQFTWTAANMQRCVVPPVPYWSSAGQIPTSGNKSVPAPVPSQASYLYEIICMTSSGNAVSSTVPVSVMPLASAAPALSIELASSSTFANPNPIQAESPNAAFISYFNQPINNFEVSVSPSEGITLKSITIKVNPGVNSNLTLTSLALYAIRDGDTADIESGLSDQAFGSAINNPIVAGQTYTFTDSMAIPATGQIELEVLAHVSAATPGTYNAPFQITNITGTGMTGGEVSLFSGNLNGQSVTVIPPAASITSQVSLDASSPSASTISPGAQQVPLLAFKMNNPSAQPLEVSLGAYLGNNFNFTGEGEIYWYDETGALVATSSVFNPPWVCSSNCSRDPSGMYSYVEVINERFFMIPADSSKILTLKLDVPSSTVSGDIIVPTLLESTLVAQSTGGIVTVSGLPLSGSALTVQ